MKIKWLGHSCFYIASGGSSLVIDPYNWKDIPGMKPYKITADKVICTHDHHDHNFIQAVTLTGKECTLKIETLNAFHDNQMGALRGPMKLFIITDGIYKAAHLGDLGHIPSEAQIKKLKNLDALMINVGGFEASEAVFANQLANILKPGLIFPFHFRGKNFGFPKSGTLEEFLELRNDAIYLDNNEMSLYKPQTSHTVVFRLNP